MILDLRRRSTGTSGLNSIGNFADDAAANTAFPDAIVGQLYFNTTTSKYKIKTAITPATWQDVDAVAGPQGPKGDDAVIGSQSITEANLNRTVQAKLNDFKIPSNSVGEHVVSQFSADPTYSGGYEVAGIIDLTGTGIPAGSKESGSTEITSVANQPTLNNIQWWSDDNVVLIFSSAGYTLAQIQAIKYVLFYVGDRVYRIQPSGFSTVGTTHVSSDARSIGIFHEVLNHDFTESDIRVAFFDSSEDAIFGSEVTRTFDPIFYKDSVNNADVRLSAIFDLTKDVSDIKAGRLGFTWRYAVKDTQNFVGSDFTGSDSSSSEQSELTPPVVTLGESKFSAIAIPISAPIGEVSYVRGLGNILTFTFLRVEVPIWIDNVPHRWYVTPQRQSALLINADLRFTRNTRSLYKRYIAVLNDQSYTADSFTTYNDSPLIDVPDFGGAARFLAFALPAGTTAPTMVRLNNPLSGNVINSFTKQATQIEKDGVMYDVYLSNTIVSTIFSNMQIIVLPESDMRYFSPPISLPNVDQGFTWYGGVASWVGTHPENPVSSTDIPSGTYTVSDTDQDIILPDTVPRDNSVTFIAQPVTSDAVTGVLSLNPNILNYRTLAELQTEAETNFQNNWNEQTDRVTVSGVEHRVYLNRISTQVWRRPTGGRRIYVYR